MISIGQSLSGIYLPILHQPKDCCHIPLAIVYTILGGTLVDNESKSSISKAESLISYHVGHFSAVVGLDYQHPTFYSPPESEESVGINCFPLVSADLHLLPLRYCYTYDIDTKLSSRGDIEKRDQLILSYLDVENLPIHSQTPRYIPVAMVRSQDERARERKVAKGVSPFTSSVVYNSKGKFFTEILQSKRNELDTLRAKMREVEVRQTTTFLSSLLLFLSRKLDSSRKIFMKQMRLSLPCEGLPSLL